MSSPFIVISSAKMVLTIRVLVVGGPAFAIQAVNDMLQPPAHGRVRKMMHITKYIHSCLLPEHKGEQLLFDPGKFSFIDGLVWSRRTNSPMSRQLSSRTIIQTTSTSHP